PFGRRSRDVETKEMQETKTRFLLFNQEVDKGCQIRLNHPDTLQQCGFNSSRPLCVIPSVPSQRADYAVAHSQVDGILENWVQQLVNALKSGPAQPVNVGLANWISLAYNHYALAVHNTRLVGQEVAALLRWLEVRSPEKPRRTLNGAGAQNKLEAQKASIQAALPRNHLTAVFQESVQFSRSNVHLIGYSLGAHVSGFAGTYIGGKHKIGRITGLDAAGPMFEGVSPSDRLSPDDANFVDAIHTFTREHMGLSVGIQRPVGHYDFYPNGGSFQPGCHFLELYKHIANHGLNAITETIKCAHERSVHLFIDSLLHADLQSKAYLCSDMDSFSQGLCLSCKKGHCNTLGYHIHQDKQSKKAKKLFLVTRAQSPFKVYHYQFKMQFINQIEKPVEPTFTMSLFGTNNEVHKIPITLGEGIISNKTYSFLITLDLDVGMLIMIKFKWENSAVWANVWNTVQTIFPWGKGPIYSGLILKSIKVKAGETQQR
ncbi:Hepatic triacylglycerol lipase, partial [Galemys pyrenaicus]